MLAWLYRILRLLFVYWKFRTNRLPAPRQPEERLRDIDADLGIDLAEWDRDFRGRFPELPAASTLRRIPFQQLSDEADAQERAGIRWKPERTAEFSSGDISPGWHHVPDTSRWEQDS